MMKLKVQNLIDYFEINPRKTGCQLRAIIDIHMLIIHVFALFAKSSIRINTLLVCMLELCIKEYLIPISKYIKKMRLKQQNPYKLLDQ